jgi:hypothetical protein
MASKGNSGNLYNYNPFTNIMPNNSNYGWVYYKYTTPSTNITHDITPDIGKLYLDGNGNSDIFVLYAGGGANGGIGNETIPINSTDLNTLASYFSNFNLTSTNYTYKGYVNSGGGGGTGEVNLTKINYNNILDKKLTINIGTSGGYNTTISYIQNNTNTNTTILAYGNNNSPNPTFNSGNNAIYNKSDRPINSLALNNNTLYCGSASGYPGTQGIKYSQRTNVSDTTTYSEYIAFERIGQTGNLTICNDFTSSTTNTPSSLKTISLTDIANGQNYLNAYDVTQAYVNFSNNDLFTDGTGVVSVLTGGNGSTYNKITNTITTTYDIYTYTDYIDSYVSQNGQNGPPGFVMVFYKTIPPKIIYNTNMSQSNFNPLNYLMPKKNYNYFLYKQNSTTNIIHTINTNNEVNSIVADSNGNMVVNILYIAPGGLGGTSTKSYGGGGGGSGGEILLTRVTLDLLKSNQIILNTTNSVTSISNILINGNIVSYTANNGNNGSNSSSTVGGDGASGLPVRLITSSYTNTNNSFITTTSYGSGSGGGGLGYLNGLSGKQGVTPTSVNSFCDNTSSKYPTYVKITDIGDGTGEVRLSSGGLGGSATKPGAIGAAGFVLIYYLVKDQM